MNKRQAEEALELIRRIADGARQREKEIERQAREEGSPVDWLRKSQPRHDMVSKLNALSLTNAILSQDPAHSPALLVAKRQIQHGTDHRFAQAVGKMDPDIQREWEAGSPHPARQPFDDSARWYSRKPQGPDQGGRSSGKPVRDETDESPGAAVKPVGRTPQEHVDGAGRFENVKDMEARAYAQLREILTGRRRQSERFATFN